MKLNEQKKLYRKNALKERDFQCLPLSRSLEVTVVSGKSSETIRKIHQILSRLTPMGEDERRSIWFEVKGKRWVWYRLSTSVYRDCYYLHISGDEYHHYVLSDRDFTNSYRWVMDDEVYDVLSKIKEYVENLTHNILTAPDQYNSYIAKYLDYHCRSGLIKRSIINSLLPTHLLDGIDVSKAIKVYESFLNPTQFSDMSLRSYMHYWRIAYEAIRGKQSGDDIEVFKQSSKGCEVKNYNLDSEDDFRRWKEDVSPYHGFDVVYARVHLFPVFENSNWHFRISTRSYWNLNECLKAVLGLTDVGIVLELGEVSHILGILKETDYVEITPYAYRYMQGKEVGSQRKLPHVEEVGRKVIRQIIENTDWEPIEKVKLIDENPQNIIHYENSIRI